MSNARSGAPRKSGTLARKPLRSASVSWRVTFTTSVASHRHKLGSRRSRRAPYTTRVGRVLACEALFRRYRTADSTIEVLKGVDFRVTSSEVAIILGPSGSGKTTLLHLLAGLDRPDSG